MGPLVIVPTYNESDNLQPLLAALLRHEGVHVLVVDDQSPDGTGFIADALASHSSGRIQVLHRTGPRGLGRSYVDGMRHALDLNAELVCQMDADFSHNPDDVPRLIDAARQGADMVIGSRYVAGGEVVNWPMHRRLLSRCANTYIRGITRMAVSDATSGFRCWRRDALRQMPLSAIVSDGYAFLVEMTWEAMRHGCRVVEIPITFVERRLGASKLSGGVMLESALLPWRLASRRRF